MTRRQVRTATTCPQCGASANGNFCQNCGGTLAGAKCPKCATTVQAGANFCHNCSVKLGDEGGRGRPLLPWFAAAAVVVLLLVVAAVSFRPSGSSPNPVAFPSPVVPQTPRAVADEYFNQAMMADERGDLIEAAAFGQRALDGYAALGGLDNDLRLHAGLIQMAMGKLEETLAQADSLELAIPGHLYASILRMRVYDLRGDSAGVESAYRRFLEYHQQEVNAGRPEYNEHVLMIENFLVAASTAVGNPR